MDSEQVLAAERLLTRRELTEGWQLNFDEGASWDDAPLHEPGTPVASINPTPPTSGWSSLDHGVDVAVPSVTEAHRPDYHGVSWWSSEVDIGDQECDAVSIRFGAARLAAEIYWDHELIGYDLEGYTPFTIPVPTSGAQPGKHRLDVRITNPGGSKGWEDIFPVMWGARALPSSHDFGGLWQPVTFIESHGAQIEDVFVRPGRALDRALVDVRYRATRSGALRVTIVDPNGDAVAERKTTVDAPGGVAALEVPVADPLLYAPGQPNRYQCVCHLVAEGEDLVRTAFGFRLLDVADGRLQLNGEPFYLRSAISQGWYSGGPIPTTEELAAEISSVEAFGQNAISVHRSVALPTLADALEERGLLLHQEPGGVPSAVHSEPDELFLKLLELRVRRLARRDRSRACLVWWNLANEALQADDGDPGPLSHRLLDALRQEDTSRITTWTSAWGRTPMLRPHQPTPGWSFDFHTIQNWPSTWNQRLERQIAALEPPESMLFLSGESNNLDSIGDLARLAADHPASPYAAWVARLTEDLDRLDPSGELSVDALCAGTSRVQAHGLSRLVETTRANPHVDGLNINGWHSHPVTGTMGMTTLDRRPACDPPPVCRANAPRAVSVQGLEPQALVGAPNTGHLVLISDVPLDDDAAATIRVAGATVDVEPTGPRALLRLSHRTWSLGDLSFTATTPGLQRMEVCIDVDDQQIATDAEFLAVERGAVPTRSIAVHDPGDDLAPWLIAQGAAIIPWTLGVDGPTIINGTNLNVLHTLFLGPPRRSAFITDTRRRAVGSAPAVAIMRAVFLEALGLAETPTEFAVAGDWVGGWAFTIDPGPLPSLGPTGVWGWSHGPTFPRAAMTGLRGRTLAGAVSFPDATLFDPGFPVAGATVTLLTKGSHEVLYVALPLTETLPDSPLSQALMLEIAQWVTGP